MTMIPVGGERCGCGNTGCWETLASATAIIREARAALERARRLGTQTMLKEPLDGKMITEAAKSGDLLATSVLEQAGRFLGIGLANLVNIFNPECIVIGGGMALAGEILMMPAQRELSRRAMTDSQKTVRIVATELGSSAGVVGAAALGLIKSKDKKEKFDL